MLLPRLTNSVENSSIDVLLSDIDNKLTALAKSQYNNIVFLLNNYIPTEAVDDLLNYKRILTFKSCNPDYAPRYTVEMIASRVKLLIHK